MNKYSEYIELYEKIFIPNVEEYVIDDSNKMNVINEYVNSILYNGYDIAYNSFKNKTIVEEKTLNSKEYVSSIYILFSVIADVHNSIFERVKDNQKLNSLLTLLEYSLKVFQNIVSLSSMSGYHGIISLFRTIYENFIITKYLVNNFFDFEAYIENANTTKDDIISILLGKPSSNRVRSFQWYSGSEKVGNLKDLAKIIGVDERYNDKFRISSEVIHCSSYSIVHEDIQKILLPIFLETTAEIIIESYKYYLEASGLDDAFIEFSIAVMYSIRQSILTRKL